MEQKWPSDKVRSAFLDYFGKKCGHLFVPSSPTIPYDDPTLLFSNSGMAQFKPIFLGTVDPKSPQASWKRACNSQKCIRAGGKHNDLDDVGKDTYHHTFFEMLGNWSFGDYFQKDAIDWAWDFLVNTLGLEPRRIYVTYFKGDDHDGVPADLAAKELWKKYLPDSHILPFGRKENFWEMGETGPCGPCSEIHYDRRSDREDAAHLVNYDDPEVIEIWNLVFMQFNREPSRALTPLPHKHVDTGMGFERLTSILQDKPSNYDTDIFMPIFEKISEITGAPPYSFLVGADDEKEGPHKGKDTAYRIVADHIRTLVFAITDGGIPSSEGRGYVLRRILRRAVRAGRHYLHAKDGFFHQLADIVVSKFGGFFPELKTDLVRVKKIIKFEEEQFQRTLGRGIQKFNRLTKDLKRGDKINGENTFLLYGTFGFPLDLIEIMAFEKGLTVDKDAFAVLLEQSKKVSQEAFAAGKTSVLFELKALALSQLQEKGVVTTIDSFKYVPDEPTLEGAVVKAIWKGDPEHGSWVDTADGDFGVILDKTNFYAESGGQLFDQGFLQNDTCTFTVKSVKVYGGIVAHIGTLTSGAIKVGEVVSCEVNFERRRPIMANHTSTHLINLGLRKTLKSPADQRGSIVSDEKFRFDFTCLEALTSEEIQNVEGVVNELIKQDLKVFTEEVPLEKAKNLHPSVRCLFAEAYPDPVRVVSVGASVDEIFGDKTSDKWFDFSIEFCGGTHLSRTSEAENFSIVSEEAVRIGERRVVGVTGVNARKAKEDAAVLEVALQALFQIDSQTEALNIAYQKFMDEFHKSTIPAVKRIEMRKKIHDIEEKMKAAARLKISKQKDEGSSLLTSVTEKLKSGGQFVIEFLVGSNNKILSDTAAEIVAACKKDLGRDVAVFLFTVDTKKKQLILLCNVPDSFHAKLKGNEWVSGVAVQFGGKGGGKPSVAQGTASLGAREDNNALHDEIKAAALAQAQSKLQ